MALSPDRGGPSSPCVALLAPHWGAANEEGWLIRQVAGALSCVGRVHVITPDGRRSSPSVDGVFTVHHLPVPVDPVAELRRDILLSELSLIDDLDRFRDDAELSAMLDRELIRPWAEAPEALSAVHPDLVVVAGHRSTGALTALEAYDRAVPMSLVALGTDVNVLTLPQFGPMFGRAQSVLAVTRSEQDGIEQKTGIKAPVHRIGAPMVANAGVRGEPDVAVGDTDYVLVLTGARSKEQCAQNELAQLLRVTMPETTVAIAHSDGLSVWHRGRVERSDPVVGSNDLARLMAWARTTVDLQPGPLFARRCVQSLLYGTPIVVPHDSRAREHAEQGRGGLWFHDATEFTECVGAMLQPGIRDALGIQGQTYAEREFGSTDAFIERVTGACGLSSGSSGSDARILTSS